MKKRTKLFQQRKLEQQINETRELEKQEAARIITNYMEKVKAFQISFNNPQTVEQVQAQQKELLEKLTDISHLKGSLRTELSDALNTLKINPTSVNDVINAKREEINSAAQELQKTIKGAQRQLEVEKRKKEAEQTLDYYMEQIKTFHINFDSPQTMEQVQVQQKELLDKLHRITHDKGNLRTNLYKALGILKISIAHVDDALDEKKKEVISAAQKLEQKIEEARCQLEEQQRKKKEEQVRAQELHRNTRAQQIVDRYMEQIKTFPMNFNSPQTMDQVQAQQKELLDNLRRITHDKGKLRTNLHTALGILKISIAHVDNALDEKKNEVISTAQKLELKIEETRQLREKEEQRRQLEEQQRKQKEEQDRVQELQRKKDANAHARQIVDNCIARINKFPVIFNNPQTVEQVHTQQTELLEKLHQIPKDKDNTGLLEALNTLKMPPSSISKVLSVKIAEITSAAQELQKKIEVTQLIVDKRKEEAQLAVAYYMEQINTFPINFNNPQTVEQVQTQQLELLEKLINISNFKGKLKAALSDALSTLNMSPDSVTDALAAKSKEINSKAQELLSNIETTQRKLNEEQQRAEQTIKAHVARITAFTVNFSGATTPALVKKQQNALLQQLAKITPHNQELSQALKILNIENQSPISNAIAKKQEEINLTAKGLEQKIEETRQLREKEEQRRQLEEQQRKQKEEQDRAQELLRKKDANAHAKQIVDNCIAKINTFPVIFNNPQTVEQVHTQKIELLVKLHQIPKDKDNTDLLEALKTLNMPPSSISKVLNVKIGEINSAAQELQKKIEETRQLREKEEQRCQQEEQQRKQKEEQSRVKEQQRKQEEEKESKLKERRFAERILNDYMVKLLTFRVDFNHIETVEQVQTQQKELLEQLNHITHHQGNLIAELSTVLNTLGKDPSFLNEAITSKSNEINSAVQQWQKNFETAQRKILEEEQRRKQEERKLREQQKKQQAKERLKSALEPYQINFEQLLGQLRNTRDSLTQQALTNSSYETVSSRVSELYNTLENEMGIFFANPSMRKFQQCHDLCAGVIESAAEEAAQHRGWHAIDPIIRGILGVLAALTVLPALIVQATSKHGYLQTFFAKPVTTTSEQITAFAVQQNEINEGINLILAP